MPTVAELDVQIDATNNAQDELVALLALIQKIENADATVDVAVKDQASDDLKRILAEIKLLEAQKATIDVDAQTQNAKIKIQQIMAEIAKMSGEIDVSADTTDAKARIREMQELLRRLDANINVNADTANARANLAMLKRQVEALDGQKINIDTDGAGGGLERMAIAAERAGGNVRGLIAAGLLLWPALVPLTAAAANAVGGFSLMVGAAGIGTGLFAAVAVTNFSKVTDAVKKIESAQRQYDVAITETAKNNALKKIQAEWDALTPSQAAAARELIRFKDTWAAFALQFEPQVFSLAAQGLNLMSGILPSLAPMVEGVATGFKNVLTSAKAALEGPFWQSFISMLNTQAGPAVETFFKGLGNIVKGLAGILMAFAPFQATWNAGFLAMTEKFANWGAELGKSQGFKDFMAYVATAVPRAQAFLTALLDAIVAIVRAVAPYGDIVLSAVTRLMEGIAALGRTAPGVLALAIALGGIGVAALALAGPIASVLRIAQILLPIIMGLGTPFLLVAAGVAAAGAAFAIAYFQFEGFRTVVNNVVSAVMTGLGNMISWLKATLAPAVAAVGVFIKQEWDKWVVWARGIAPLLAPAWNAIVSGIQTAGGLIKSAWNLIWPPMEQVVRTVWDMIKSVVSGGMEIIRGVISVALGILTGNWSTAWNGLQSILKGIWTILVGVVKGGLELLLSAFLAFFPNFKSNWDTQWAMIKDAPRLAWEAIKTAAQTAWTGIKTILQTEWNSIRTTAQTVWTAITTFFATTWTSMRTAAQTAWTTIKTILQTEWNSIRTTAQTIWTAIQTFFRTTMTAIQTTATTIWTAIRTFITTTMNTIRTTFQTVWTAIRTFITTALNAIRTTAQTVWTAIRTFITTTMNAIRTTFQTVWTAIRTFITTALNAIRTTVTTVWNAIRTTVTTVMNAIRTAIQTAWTAIRTFITTTLNTIRSAIQTAWNTIRSVISTAMSTILSVIRTGFSNAVSAVRTAMSNFLNAIRTGINNALSAIRTGISNMISAITGAAGRFYSAGVSMLSGFVDGVRSKIGDAVSAVGEGIAKIAGMMPGSPAEYGPLSGQGYTKIRGQHLMEDMAAGMRRKQGLVERQARELASIMAMSSPAELGSTWGSLPTGRGRSAAGSTINLGGVMLEVKVGAGASVSDAREAFSGAGDELATKIADAIRRR